MKETMHTPTPWSYNEGRTVAHIKDAQDDLIFTLPKKTERQYEAGMKMVRILNLHAELVGALEEILSHHGMTNPPWLGNAKNVVKRARGEA